MIAWRALRSRYAEGADPLRTQRRLELAALLLGLVICLQLVFGLIGLAVSPGPGAIEPAADSLRVPAVSAARVVAAAERNEIISRPLFWVGRRPLEPGPVIAPPGSEQEGSKDLKEVKLVGLFGGGDTVGAIVLVKGEKQRILRGEAVAGWTLETIGSGDAVFARDARRESLALERAVASSAPTDEAAGAASKPSTPPAQIEVKMPRAIMEREKPAKADDKAAAKAAGQQGGSSLSLGPGAGQGSR